MFGFPWWLSGKESACQCRRHGFDPWPRKIPHTTEQLTPFGKTTWPVLQSPRSTSREGTAVRSSCVSTREQALLTPAREKPVQRQRPSTAKNKNLKEIYKLQKRACFPFLVLKIANKDPMKYMHIWKYWKGNINTLRRLVLIIKQAYILYVFIKFMFGF